MYIHQRGESTRVIQFIGHKSLVLAASNIVLYIWGYEVKIRNIGSSLGAGFSLPRNTGTTARDVIRFVCAHVYLRNRVGCVYPNLGQGGRDFPRSVLESRVVLHYHGQEVRQALMQVVSNLRSG